MFTKSKKETYHGKAIFCCSIRFIIMKDEYQQRIGNASQTNKSFIPKVTFLMSIKGVQNKMSFEVSIDLGMMFSFKKGMYRKRNLDRNLKLIHYY